MRRMAVRAHERVREGDAVLRMDHRRHSLQIDLVHDAVARRNDLDVLERFLRPVDEVEAVFVAPVFHGAVLRERVLVEAAVFHRERMVDDELRRHHRVYLRRVAAHVRNGITQTGQVHQCGLAEDVVANHTRRKPREVEVALALDELAQRNVQRLRAAATHQVFGVNARGVGQPGPGTSLQRFNSASSIKVIEFGARQRLAVGSIHGLQTRSLIGGTGRSSGPT